MTPSGTAAAVKICGLSTEAQVDGAVEAGAAFLGFNFFPKSPRWVSFEAARALALRVPVGRARVGLVVDEDDAFIEALVRQVPLDLIQLHGRETAERVVEVKQRFGLPVIKAVGIAERADLAALDTFGAVADVLLVDAKPAEGAKLPGGNGLSFDWSLIADRQWPTPWMLAGGLTPQNAREARLRTGAPVLDVSSGVETAPGVKDLALMKAFVAAAGAAPD